MKIKQIIINNILSIENASITIPDSGMTLIEGWNYDSDRANGAGKTAIFNAMCFAIYGQIPRKITATEILRRGTKKGFAEVIIENGNDLISIKRSRPSGLIVTKNNNIININQEELEALISLSYDQFMLTVYNPQKNEILSAKYNRFLNLSDSDKKSFLLRLIDLNKFDFYRENIDSQYKTLHSQLNIIDMKINNHAVKIDTYLENVHDNSLLEKQLCELQQKQQDVQLQLDDINHIDRPITDSVDLLLHNLQQKLNQIMESKYKRPLLMEKLKSFIVNINSIDAKVCSSCGSDISHKVSDHELASMKDKIKLLKEEIDNCNLLLATEEKITEYIQKTKIKQSEILLNFNKQQNISKQCQIALNNIINDIRRIEKSIKDNLDLQGKISNLKRDRASLQQEKDTTNSELSVLKTISHILSPSGAQAYILDNIINLFNECLQDYINLLWPNTSYELRTYKENHKGEITTKFSEHLFINGQEVSIGSLSGGEFRALSLCVDFAILSILEKSTNKSINPIILDESFDGLDVAGRELVLDLLQQLSLTRHIYVIDHTSEMKSRFSNIITIEKRDNISQISIEI